MKPPLMVAYGGGVNSSAMLVEMSRRGHRPDAILFADTGGERPETYAAVRKVSDWCVAHGFPAIETVSYVSKKRGDETLEGICLRTKSLPSIAFGFKSCSEKYKIRPQDRWLRNWPAAAQAWSEGLKVIKAIGYDAGEVRRAKTRTESKFAFWYPLVEWGIYREDCVEICKSEGLPTAKSSCFFCPSMRKHEVLDLAKTHPDLLKRALDMEANAHLTSVKGLGRSYAWSDLVKNANAQCDLFSYGGEPETPCGCYDG